MQSIHYDHSPREQSRLLDFYDSETETAVMVISTDEISLSEFMRCYTETATEKDHLFVFRYDIWPWEHSRHCLYRWLAETASGRACLDTRAWAEFIETNLRLKSQLELLKSSDHRPLAVRFLEAIRFVAAKLSPEQSLILNFAPLTVSHEPALVVFFKSILRLLPPRTKMIINQCEKDVLARQDDFCPSDRIKINSAAPDDTAMLLERYYHCYHDNGINGRLMRALVYMAQPISVHELSLFTGIAEDEIRAASASADFRAMVWSDGQGNLRLAYPRLFFPRVESIRRSLANDMAELNQAALTYYQDLLSRQPDSNAAIGHSLCVSRLTETNELAYQAMNSYQAKLELGAGEISEMELQHALELIDPDQKETRALLRLALAEVQETLGRNHDALDALETAALFRSSGQCHW